MHSSHPTVTIHWIPDKEAVWIKTLYIWMNKHISDQSLWVAIYHCHALSCLKILSSTMIRENSILQLSSLVMKLTDNRWTGNSSTRRMDVYVVSCIQAIESVWEWGVREPLAMLCSFVALRGACDVSIHRINGTRIKGSSKNNSWLQIIRCDKQGESSLVKESSKMLNS